MSCRRNSNNICIGFLPRERRPFERTLLLVKSNPLAHIAVKRILSLQTVSSKTMDAVDIGGGGIHQRAFSARLLRALRRCGCCACLTVSATPFQSPYRTHVCCIWASSSPKSGGQTYRSWLAARTVGTISVNGGARRYCHRI